MKRVKYTEEYKLKALDLVKRNGSFKGTARELGIDDKTLRHWARCYNKPASVSELRQAEQLEKEAHIHCLKKQIRELEKQVRFLAEASVFLPAKKQMKYQYIEQHRGKDLSLAVTCKLLSVSRSGYHKWRNRMSDKSTE